MIRTFFALLLAGALLAALMYLCSQLFPTPTATSAIHQTIDNHTQVIVNKPFDLSGAALSILAITALLYVVFTVIIPSVRNWRQP